jgi:GNAT superfamily N-acetyltransferase
LSTAPRVRRASLEDLPQVTSLRLQWGASRGLTGDTEDFAGQLRAWWERQGDSRVFWLAYEDELAIGMANLAVFERMPLVGVPNGRWGYLGNVWVDPAQRRRGVATALMTAAIDWCRAGSFQRIVVNPSEMSASLYLGLGFRPADELMRLDL